jgi:hypothetical protein
MPAINFQNNFGTNLTSGTTAGDTTSPLNSIPTVDAPYYLAFDATNVNAHYEVVYVTSDTATNVNHAATTYDHTTAEEVRMIQPAVHLNTMQNMAEGTLINGKILPTVASNNLTVTLQTQAGANPSVTDPVYVMIGGTLRSITSALGIVVPAGTNWGDAGSVTTATKEIDWFAYLQWDTVASAVKLGISRLPFGNLISDFSGTGTAETALLGYTNLTATDVVVNIGRFAATLSAGAGYTWTVPTYTAKNLIQKPIFETRWLDWVPQYTNITIGSGTSSGAYKIVGRQISFYGKFVFGGGSAVGTIAKLSKAPLTTTYDAKQPRGGVTYYDSNIATYFNGQFFGSNFGIYTATGDYTTFVATSATVPFTWDTSDEIIFGTITERIS